MVLIKPALNGSADGILNYMSRKYKSIYNAFVTATGSTYYSVNNWGEPKVLLKRGIDRTKNENSWCSDHRYQYPFIQFDFPMHPITLTHYTMKSDSAKIYVYTNWIVEGSNDSINWDAIDQKIGYNKGVTGKQYTYKCDKIATYNHFKITMKSTNGENNWHFIIHEIEFFGSILIFGVNSCRRSRSSIQMNILLLTIAYLK